MSTSHGCTTGHQPYWRVRSFTRRLSFCSRLALNQQSWHRRNGWRFVVWDALCRQGTDRAAQSVTWLVTWQIIWQQSTWTLFRSVLASKARCFFGSLILQCKEESTSRPTRMHCGWECFFAVRINGYSSCLRTANFVMISLWDPEWSTPSKMNQ